MASWPIVTGAPENCSCGASTRASLTANDESISWRRDYGEVNDARMWPSRARSNDGSEVLTKGRLSASGKVAASPYILPSISEAFCRIGAEQLSNFGGL
jgi:hypothetical protein